MTEKEALKLCDELGDIIGDAPGTMLNSRKRAKKILSSMNSDPQATPYLREKTSDLMQFLEIWRSERRWMTYGDDPSRLRSIVHNCLGKLEGAVGQAFSSTDN